MERLRAQRAAVGGQGTHTETGGGPAAGRREQDAHAAAPSRPPPRPRRGRIFFAVLLLLATVLPGSMCAGPFQFMARSHNSTREAPPGHQPHLAKKLQGQLAPNITVSKQRWDASARKRWDATAGGEIDGMLKDDGPKQLQSAMLVLCAVAGTVICGGACGIVCLWTNRERGWSSAAKIKRMKGAQGEYAEIDDPNPYQGGGAEWLKNPV